MTWKLAGYEVEDLLGFGASGQVWRGRVAGSGQLVALKRMEVQGAAQLQAARAEAALLATLDHAHLVQLHELVVLPDAVVLVLDLAAGGSLADLLERRGRLTPGEVITALAPIGAALAYAHNEGVVHGDVSAGNVLFTDIGLPLLADLGVARIIGDERPVRSTPAYLDPAVANGHPPGPQTDVFSLAAVAVHALSGRPIWAGTTSAEMIANAAGGEIPDLDERLTGLAPGMRTVLERALDPDPQLRGTAADFALDLRHSGEPLAVEQTAGRSSRGGEADGRPRLASTPGQSADSARPSFERPGALSERDDLAVRAGQLTHGVRVAMHKAPAPRRSPAGGLRAVLSGRLARLALVAVGVLLAVVAVGALVQARSAGSNSAAPAVSSSTLSAPTVAPLDAESAATVLRQLDTRRQQAFLDRDPQLLASVYVPGALLDQDTAVLTNTVPAGCSMTGVHTDYSGVRLTTSAPPTLLVTAVLAPSTLTCGGVLKAVAPGTGPTSLRIELLAQDGAYLIAAQQVVS
jgi:hypothetical protein